MSKVKTAVVPVAGFGTRFLPFTKAIPKAMLPIVDKPVVQLIVEELHAGGIEKVIFIVGQHSNVIKNHFLPSPELEKDLAEKGKNDLLLQLRRASLDVEFSFIYQAEQKGTAHAVSLAREELDGQPFLLAFGDDLMYNPEYPVAKQLIDVFDKYGKTVLGVKRVPFADVPKYASVEYSGEADHVFFVDNIREKPPITDIKSNLAPLGRYVCSGDIFEYISKLQVGINGEYQITDAFNDMCKTSEVVAYEFSGKRYDTGDKLGYLEAVCEYSLRDEYLGEKFKEYLKKLAETLK